MVINTNTKNCLLWSCYTEHKNWDLAHYYPLVCGPCSNKFCAICPEWYFLQLTGIYITKGGSRFQSFLPAVNSPVGFKYILDQRFLDWQHLRELLVQFWCIKFIVALSCNDDLCLLFQSKVLPWERWVNVLYILDQRFLDWQHLRELLVQFWCIKFIVVLSCNDDLCLLFQSKVLPWERWVNVLLIHLQNLIVAHHSWVGKIPDSPQILLCHFNGNRQQLIQDCHAIGNVHHLLIPGNLHDEISWVLKIWSDGHPHTQGAHIVKLFQEFFNLSSIQSRVRIPN